jgi:hypothetical protein
MSCAALFATTTALALITRDVLALVDDLLHRRLDHVFRRIAELLEARPFAFGSRQLLSEEPIPLGAAPSSCAGCSHSPSPAAASLTPRLSGGWLGQ